MSHGKLREEKNCLNCGHHVEEKFCPNCGQENTENRRPFYYLFTHFIEDFTHYDGQFWGTIKNLLFKPGKLTETYLEGKRQQFVPPVKLYIFISFITFFWFAVFPPFKINFDDTNVVSKLTDKKIIDKVNLGITQKMIDSIKTQPNISQEDSVAIEKLSEVFSDSIGVNSYGPSLNLNEKMEDDFDFGGYKTRKSYDSANAKNSGSFDFIKTPIAHQFFELKEKGVKKGDILKNLLETSFHNLPKALFIYLPIFAFFLWIFHKKKKWWYFDHGVFTLHYFAFLLLNILFFALLFKASKVIGISWISTILYFVMAAIAIYSVLYFFIAHHRVYHTHGMLSFIIGSVLFTVNFIAFMFLVIGLALVSFLMIH